MGNLDGAACVECGRYFPANDLVYLNNSPVCAACKPVYLQRLTEGAALPGGGLWRQSNRVVMARGSEFPDRCIKCNAAANGFRLKGSTLYVTGIAPSRIVWYVGLCDHHRKRLRLGWIIFWSGLGASLLFLGGAAAFDSSWCGLLALFSLFGFGLTGAVMASTLRVAKVTREHLWLLGCKRAFLESLPDWPGW